MGKECPDCGKDHGELIGKIKQEVSNSALSCGLSCPVCGGKVVYIRGRHPGDDKRIACPTCLQEKIDDINIILSVNYGRAYEDGAT